MISIAMGSKKVEQEVTAQANNPNGNPATAQDMVGRDIPEHEDKTPGFSKAVAAIRNEDGEKLGAASALVLRYLSHQVRK